MARLKFSAAALSKHFGGLGPGQKSGIVWDTETRGLGAYKSGEKGCTLFVHFRLPNGQQRKKTLGRLNEIGISEARVKAVEYALAARHGRDIVAEQKTAECAALTLGEAYEAYSEALQRRGASPNTLKLNQQNWTRFLSRHQGRAIASLTKREVREWHTRWGKHGPTIANQSGRLLRAVLNYAAKIADGLPPNPCSAIEFFAERNRRRSVSTNDLAAWWASVERIPNPVRRAYWKILLFSGLRKEDAATIRWDEVFEDRIHRPNPKGGRAKAFDVPMTAQLRAIITEAKSAHERLFPDSPFVFPANGRAGYLSNPRESRYLSDCSPHDLRRTYATACVEAGVDPYVIKMLLNHAPDTGDVTSRYVRVSAEHKVEAGQRVANYLYEKTK